ncbi:MFS transporter [Chelatococcus asaccharovorans]|uniref:Sugar phosphate permease n=1 Tax=Chelatococcus asaccharovorans TaxID=28210 RepID=A0A2V3UIA4_9HYPH|nr:MFS transporter [Chelatococcus asaccharovorans]MBS7701803.1 MFS transporter [Chelatococcus asaccharovorans]PXW64490.1 sugar phosphate permease [Chelatococcus asaccharovorans]
MSTSATLQARWDGRQLALLGKVCLAHFVSHFHIMTLPALIPLLPAHFGVGFLEIGFALTVFNLVTLVAQTPVGFLTDRLGPRRLLVAGLVLGGLSFIGLAFTPTYPLLLVGMACAGLANCVYHPADYAWLSHGIDGGRMGKAFSFHTFAGYFGGAIAPAVLLGTAAFGGIPLAFAVAGGIGCLVAIVIAMTPGDGVHQANGLAPAQGAGQATRGAGIATLLSPAILVLVVLFMLLNLSTGGLQNFSVSALTTGYGVDLVMANAALSGFLFASAFGVLAGGVLADRTSRHGYVAAGAFGITAILVAIIAVANLSDMVLVVMLTAAGFLSGVIAPSRDMLVRAAAPRGAEGRVFGIVTTGFNIANFSGPLFFAWLLDRGLPSFVFGAAAVFMVLTVALTLGQERSAARQRAET